jgi:hypothetical protein
VETQSRETSIEDAVIKFTQRMRCGDKHLCKMDTIPSGDKGLSSRYKTEKEGPSLKLPRWQAVSMGERSAVLNSRGNNSSMQEQQPQGYEKDVSLCLLSLTYSVSGNW